MCSTDYLPKTEKLICEHMEIEQNKNQVYVSKIVSTFEAKDYKFSASLSPRLHLLGPYPLAKSSGS